ncbi:MAG: DUF1272 domain-containing protein [Saprospiraceae bacterium]
MLQLRPSCEHCNKDLPVDSTEAMICTFECTFCKDCVENILENVCPNCSGGFVERPVRPKKYRNKYPASSKRILKEIDLEKFKILKKENKEIPPEKR